MERGLAFRTTIAGTSLVLLFGATCLLILTAVDRLRTTARLSDNARDELIAADAVQEVVVDMGSGLRGYALTGQSQFLTSWTQARDAFPARTRALESLSSDNPDEARQVQLIVGDTGSYIQNYAEAVMLAVRRGDPSARSVAVTDAGQQRMDTIDAEIATLKSMERVHAAARQHTADAAARRASITALIGLVASVLLVFGFTLYLSRVVVIPVRRTAAMAGRLAAGALDARLPVTGSGEIGKLQRAFNLMADSLEEGRRELTASRARIVAASDQARRRVERNLHDGAQQRLVSLSLELRLAQMTDPPLVDDLRAGLGRAADDLTEIVDDLREMAQGIHPAILTERGIGPALRTLARRSAVPVEVDTVVAGRFPDQAEAGAYYIVSEALANAAKHARASIVHIGVEHTDHHLRLTVRDDGVGGADASRGSGLVGLHDRAQALGGSLTISSPAGEGTTIVARLPVAPPAPDEGIV